MSPFQWYRIRQHDRGHRGLPGGLHPGRRPNHRGRSGEREREAGSGELGPTDCVAVTTLEAEFP